MQIYPRQSEKEATIRDAQSSLGKTTAERMAMFRDLLYTIDVLWANLTLEERLRRLQIHRKIHARPKHWWKAFRPEALAEHAAGTDSTD